jgi:hypothetical protein
MGSAEGCAVVRGLMVLGLIYAGLAAASTLVVLVLAFA